MKVAICTFGLAIVFAHGPNKSSAQQKQEPNNTPNPPVTVNCNCESNEGRERQDGANQKPTHPHTGIEYSQWALVILGAGTLVVIYLQTRATARSAKAAEIAALATERTASALINSERAWVLVDAKLPNGSHSFSHNMNGSSAEISLDLSNAGRAPAWVYEQRVQMVIGNDAPPRPEFDETAFLDAGAYSVTENRPATPDKAFVSANGPIPDPLKGIHAYVYGVVRYSDPFSQMHETYFGYVLRGNNRLERLPNEAYNKCT